MIDSLPSPRLLSIAAALAVAMVSLAQEAPPTPPAAVESPAPAPLVALPCVSSPARGFFSRPQVPMPPELSGDVALVTTQAVRVTTQTTVSGSLVKGSARGGKAPSLKPYAVKDLEFEQREGEWSRTAVPAFGAVFGVHSVKVVQGFSFRLVNEEAPAAAPVGVRCAWGLAASTASASKGKWGVEMNIPQGNVMACELSDGADVGPWRLFLWVGAPSNLVPPEFPSGGGLVRGEARYESTSTNAIKPALMGLGTTHITGTFFAKQGRTVAAVERLVPGRILMQCSLPPAEQSLFVAAGAAIFIRDGQASWFEK